MSEATPVLGSFVWYELMSGDVQTAAAFYSELLGWSRRETDMGPMGTYVVFSAGEREVAGLMALRCEGNVPPAFWTVYLSVDDVDARSALAESLGGELHMPPKDIPGIGRFSIIFDRQRAGLALFKPTQPVEARESNPQPGEFCWNEVMTTDVESAKGFYGELFGWSFTSSDMGEAGTYTVAMRGEVQAAGLMTLPPGVPAPPHWLSYVFVSDLDATTAKVVPLGGEVLMPVTPIPEIGRFSLLKDPTGGVLALFGTAE